MGSLGVLGGTFNPPHRGHLELARAARRALGLERVLMMPAARSPHKRDEPDPGPAHRLAMCRLAAGRCEGIEACAMEVERGGPSYTVDTLRAIHASHPHAELTFIVGADTAGTLPSWREPRELLGLAGLAVAERGGTGREDLRRTLGALTGPAPPRVRFLEMPEIEISSSAVRACVARGEPVEGLVGADVAAYIEAHGLYRGAGGSER